MEAAFKFLDKFQPDSLPFYVMAGLFVVACLIALAAWGKRAFTLDDKTMKLVNAYHSEVKELRDEVKELRSEIKGLRDDVQDRDRLVLELQSQIAKHKEWEGSVVLLWNIWTDHINNHAPELAFDQDLPERPGH